MGTVYACATGDNKTKRVQINYTKTSQRGPRYSDTTCKINSYMGANLYGGYCMTAKLLNHQVASYAACERERLRQEIETKTNMNLISGWNGSIYGM